VTLADTATARDEALARLSANTAAELTASEFRSELARGAISVLDFVQACADRIERFDPELKAFRRFDRDLVEARARRIDDARARGEALARLTGVPVGVKDVFNTYDYPTGMGSPIIDGYTPGNDARAVSDLRLEGGIVMGKTTTAEFAVHTPPATVNPYDTARTPGTSSSGSAVAVATRMVPVSLVSQTAGSIMRPASYCGVMGFKPSFGLVPRTAMLKTTDTLDTVGYMARSVADLRMMFETTRVRGHNYPVSEAALNDPARQAVTGRPWRVRILRSPLDAHAAPAARSALDRLVQALAGDGCEVADWRLPEALEEAHELHERIYRRSLAYYFQIEWNANAELFSPVLRAMIESGQTIPAERYQDDLRRQRELARLFDAAAAEWDVLLCLSTADEAPVGLASRDLPDHCLIWTLVGAPALSLPLAGGSSGLPVGIQMVARRFADDKLLAFAERVADASGA
jgi:Asp-tRNA(Asn)/Glu-tRNA(Gln) amidotransferase A subunit family amidase